MSEEMADIGEAHSSPKANIETPSSTKRGSEEPSEGEPLDHAKTRKLTKLEERKVPNIALELAKNRTAAKAVSPSPRTAPVNILSAPLASGNDKVNQDDTAVKQGKTEQDIKKSHLATTSRVRVSSLLSPDSNGTSGGIATAPKIILPTQRQKSATNGNDAGSAGFLVARTNSPVYLSPNTPMGSIERSHSTLNPLIPSQSPQKAGRASSLPLSNEIEERSTKPVATLEKKPKSTAKTSSKGVTKRQRTVKGESSTALTAASSKAQNSDKVSLETSPSTNEEIEISQENEGPQKAARKRRANPRQTKTIDVQPANVIIEDMQKVSAPKNLPVEKKASELSQEKNQDSGSSKVNMEISAPESKSKKPVKKASKPVAPKAGSDASAIKNPVKSTDSKKEVKGSNAAQINDQPVKKSPKDGNGKKTSKAASKKDSHPVEDKTKSNTSKPESKTGIKTTMTEPASSSDSKKEVTAADDKKDSKPKDAKLGGKDDNKKEVKTKKVNATSKKKEPTPQPSKKAADPKNAPISPKKLLPAPVLKSPSILEALDKGKGPDDNEDPMILIDVPLYPVESNNYMDENGQVVFNFYKMVQDKFGQSGKTKRNLISELQGREDEDDDAAEVEDDDGVDDDEDEDVEDDDKPSNLTAPTSSPKKKSHPMKGRSLIGKYDTEDLFIDDSELLWEEQRVSTKDGFFVYFGPLIEKGQYASFERVNGTMKRGGIKYSK
ncbi:LADA_0A03862g1_1 [Lachancea dasiensis]|uniref:LADA_0A03862g1_1 n=1 Tax=Lachancea dasiensis TaxID=1072105 RepID=A0A1G4IN39_9SACH|nr:LADA_0A03862g1_1 [Lachancea dasiensis]